MDIALVTGADAGPGLAIARRLIGMGCRVYALATQFSRNPFPHDDFIPLSCDLADPAALTKVAEDIVAREGHISFVVHAARLAPASLLDSPIADLVQRVNVGLLAPLALVRATLPWLRKEQGHFLVLCWNGDGPAPGGPVTAAIEGGLHHFTDALFDELRSDGIRATTLYARPNAETTPEAAFALDPQSAINPELVADTVEHLFRARPSNVVSSLIIRPAALSETPRLLRSSELAGLATRDVQLPPRQNFPQEPEPIPTPDRARPADAPPPSAEDFDDEEDEEDWDPEEEQLPWAPNREDEFQGPREDAPPRREGEGRPPAQRGYDQNQGGGNRGGRGARGGRRRRGRGGRGQPNDNYGNRPPGDRQQRPQGQGRPNPNQPPPRPESDYPDPEKMAEERSFARDDSFRTPHSESDEEGGDDRGPSDDNRENQEPRDDRPSREDSFSDDAPAPVGAETRRDDEAPRSSHDDREPRREPSRSRESNYPREPVRYGDRPSRDEGDRRQSEGQQDSGHQQGGGQSENRGGGQQGQRGGGGSRRHRGYGRRPPPGGGRGPGRE